MAEKAKAAIDAETCEMKERWAKTPGDEDQGMSGVRAPDRREVLTLMFGRREKPAQTGRFTNRTPAVKTDRAHGQVWCRYCGGKVRSRLGDVCSHPKCQHLALSAAGAVDESDGAPGQWQAPRANRKAGAATRTAARTAAKTTARKTARAR